MSRVDVWTDPAAAAAPSALTATELRRLLDDDQVEVHFQPKLEVASGTVVGVEALLRWRHPVQGIRGPAEILAAAEVHDQLPQITQRVLDQALRACAGWLSTGTRLPVAVNVTPADLADRALPDTVRDLLDAHRLPGELLTLEVTEAAVLQDHAGTAEVVARLRRLGVSLAIDDFGAGYSSLARLVQLPLAELKVDMSLVLGMHASPQAAAAVKAVIDLGHVLGMRVVAEGVEDERTLTELRSMGCDLAQGYLFTAALPAGELADWVDVRARRTEHQATAPVGARSGHRPFLGTAVAAAADAIGRRTLLAAAAMLVPYLAWQVFRWGGPAHQRLIGDLSFVPVNGAAILAAVFAARAHGHDRATRGAWTSLAVALSAYLAGDGVQTYYELVGHQGLPFPSWADLGYLSFYPLTLLALLLFPGRSRSRQRQITLGLDMAIVALGGSAVIWVAALAPTAAAGGDSEITSILTSLAYPAGDLVLMFGCVSLLFRSHLGTTALPVRLLLSGFGLYLITDMWYSHLQLTGDYQGGDLVDTGWIIAQVLLLLAASAHTRHPTESAPPARPRAEAEQAEQHGSRLPYLAIAVAYILLIVTARHAPLNPLGGLVLAVGGITGLVTLRQLAAMRENLQLLRRYHTLAATDGLTGLHNRRHLLELAETQFGQAHRLDRPLSVLMIDIDHFKKINDRFGHQVGDQVLRAVAETCRSQLRPEDLVGRYGGDELIAVLPDADRHASMLVAERLQERLTTFFEATGVGPVPATLSIGIAEITGTRSLDAMLAQADLALYAAKRDGRNCIRSYTQ